MFTNKGYYNTSTDYTELFRLLCEGQTVICLSREYSAGEKTDRKTVCQANRHEPFFINITTSGVGYVSVSFYHKDKFPNKTEAEIFAMKCKEMEIEWVLCS